MTELNLNGPSQTLVLSEGVELKMYGPKDGPMFKASDVAGILDHSNSRKMLDMIDEQERCNLKLERGGTANFITEDGLYECLMLSRKPEARKFKRTIKKLLKGLRSGAISIGPNLPNFENPAEAAIAWAEQYKAK